MSLNGFLPTRKFNAKNIWIKSWKFVWILFLIYYMFIAVYVGVEWRGCVYRRKIFYSHLRLSSPSSSFLQRSAWFSSSTLISSPFCKGTHDSSSTLIPPPPSPCKGPYDSHPRLSPFFPPVSSPIIRPITANYVTVMHLGSI